MPYIHHVFIIYDWARQELIACVLEGGADDVKIWENLNNLRRVPSTESQAAAARHIQDDRNCQGGI